MAGLTPVRPGRFQSTLSVRRATGYLADIIAQANISIHALRKESDTPMTPKPVTTGNFNPRSP